MENIKQPKPEMTHLIISERLYNTIQDLYTNINLKDCCGDVRIRLDFLTTVDGGVALVMRVPSDTPNCFDIRKGEISYFKGIQPIEESGKWSRKGRQVMKVSKFLNIIQDYLRVDLDDYDSNSLAGSSEARNKLKSRALEIFGEMLKPFNREIKITEDVFSVYSMDTSGEGTGTLEKSCMRPEVWEKYKGSAFLDVYNKLKCKIAYITDKENKLAGRALLWDDVINEETGERFRFMDRIYGSDKTIEAFKEWAEENGYAHKAQQTFRDCTLVSGNESWKKFRKDIELKPSLLKGLPYFDSFYYIDVNFDGDSASLISIKTIPNHSAIELQCTDGGYFTYSKCPKCGRMHPNENALINAEDTGMAGCVDCLVHSNITGGYYEFYDKIYIYGDREYVPKNWDGVDRYGNLYIVYRGDHWERKDRMIKCNTCGMYIKMDSAVVNHASHRIECPSCAERTVEHNSHYYSLYF